MSDRERLLIHMPRGENYIELLGYRIDGYDSLEAFLEKLNKYAELKEENEELKILTGLQRKRKYYNRFVKEVWQKEHGKLSYPDFDEIYKRYFEQKERFDRIVKQLENASCYIEDGDGHAGHVVFTDEAIDIVRGNK